MTSASMPVFDGPRRIPHVGVRRAPYSEIVVSADDLGRVEVVPAQGSRVAAKDARR
jgi:hypothetical protein